MSTNKSWIRYVKYVYKRLLKLPLARQDIPLPSGVPIQISFNRAAAAKSLLQVTATKNGSAVTYDHSVVPLISPVLSCYFVESEKAETFYSKSKLYDVSISFPEYNIRRELLLDKVANHNVKLFEGRLPRSMVLALAVQTFEGDMAKSTFKFESHGLESIDIQIDNQSIDGYPLCTKDGNAICFYLDYLRSTNRFENAFASGALNYSNFVDSNFLIFVNLKNHDISTGQLTAKLKFSSALSEKLLLLYMPVFDKQITFDQYFNVTVNSDI